jgi:hypothetical protein
MDWMMGLTDVNQPLGALERITRPAIGDHVGPDPFGTWCGQAGKLVGVQWKVVNKHGHIDC